MTTIIFDNEDGIAEETESAYGSVLLALRPIAEFPIEVRNVICDQLISHLQKMKQPPPQFNEAIYDAVTKR